MSGWIFGGAMSCTSCRSKSRALAISKQYESCQQDLSLVEGMSNRDSTDYNFSELAFQVTRSKRLGTALDNDSSLREEVKKRAKTVLANVKAYRWLLRGRDRQASEFANWRETIADSDLDNDTKVLATWLAALPSKSRTGWDALQDSEATDVCGRGPIRMTYRQAVHLGMTAQPDALYIGMSSSLDSKEMREELLADTLSRAQQPPFEPPIETDIIQVMGGAGYCVYMTGDDDRTRMRRTARALERHLGPDARGLPNTGQHSASTARIAKYFASDMTTVDFTRREPGIEFTDDSVPGAVLSGYESRGQWVLGKTAQTIAHAVVLPCLAVLEGDQDRVKNVLGEENLPNPVHCLVLAWKLQHEE